MVIVHPDQVAVGGCIGHGVGKELVHFFVRFPGFVVEGDGLVVEDWPEDLV